MEMEQTQILTQMEDPEDMGLKAVMGEKFRDVRKEPVKKTAAPEGRKKKRGYGLMWLIPLGFFWFWHSRGMMDSAAAIPCLVVCSGLAGYCLGKQGV